MKDMIFVLLTTVLVVVATLISGAKMRTAVRNGARRNTKLALFGATTLGAVVSLLLLAGSGFMVYKTVTAPPTSADPDGGATPTQMGATVRGGDASDEAMEEVMYFTDRDLQKFLLLFDLELDESGYTSQRQSRIKAIEEFLQKVGLGFITFGDPVDYPYEDFANRTGDLTESEKEWLRHDLYQRIVSNPVYGDMMLRLLSKYPIVTTNNKWIEDNIRVLDSMYDGTYLTTQFDTSIELANIDKSLFEAKARGVDFLSRPKNGTTRVVRDEYARLAARICRTLDAFVFTGIVSKPSEINFNSPAQGEESMSRTQECGYQEAMPAFELVHYGKNSAKLVDLGINRQDRRGMGFGDEPKPVTATTIPVATTPTEQPSQPQQPQQPQNPPQQNTDPEKGTAYCNHLVWGTTDQVVSATEMKQGVLGQYGHFNPVKKAEYKVHPGYENGVDVPYTKKGSTGVIYYDVVKNDPEPELPEDVNFEFRYVLKSNHNVELADREYPSRTVGGKLIQAPKSISGYVCVTKTYTFNPVKASDAGVYLFEYVLKPVPSIPSNPTPTPPTTDEPDPPGPPTPPPTEDKEHKDPEDGSAANGDGEIGGGDNEPTNPDKPQGQQEQTVKPDDTNHLRPTDPGSLDNPDVVNGGVSNIPITSDDPHTSSGVSNGNDPDHKIEDPNSTMDNETPPDKVNQNPVHNDTTIAAKPRPGSEMAELAAQQGTQSGNSDNGSKTQQNQQQQSTQQSSQTQQKDNSNSNDSGVTLTENSNQAGNRGDVQMTRPNATGTTKNDSSSSNQSQQQVSQPAAQQSQSNSSDSGKSNQSNQQAAAQQSQQNNGSSSQGSQSSQPAAQQSNQSNSSSSSSQQVVNPSIGVSAPTTPTSTSGNNNHASIGEPG